MKKQIVIYLVAVFCFGWFGVAEAEISAEEWLSGYKEAEKNYRERPNPETKILHFMYRNQISSIEEGIGWADTHYKKENENLANFKPLLCLPSNLALTISQLADILERLVKKVPKMASLPLGLVLVYGLSDTFPCEQQ